MLIRTISCWPSVSTWWAGDGLRFVGGNVGELFLDDSGFFRDTDIAGSAFPPVSSNGIRLATLLFQAGADPGMFSLALATDPLNFGFSEGLFTELSVVDIANRLSINVLARTVAVSVMSIVP